MKKYTDSETLIKECEVKINYCMNETFSEIDKILQENIESSLLVIKENAITKIINKVVNIFSGKSKFENKVKNIESNIQNLVINNDIKVETIRQNTIHLVEEILKAKESLNSGSAA